MSPKGKREKYYTNRLQKERKELIVFPYLQHQNKISVYTHNATGEDLDKQMMDFWQSGRAYRQLRFGGLKASGLAGWAVYRQRLGGLGGLAAMPHRTTNLFQFSFSFFIFIFNYRLLLVTVRRHLHHRRRDHRSLLVAATTTVAAAIVPFSSPTAPIAEATATIITPANVTAAATNATSATAVASIATTTTTTIAAKATTIATITTAIEAITIATTTATPTAVAVATTAADAAAATTTATTTAEATVAAALTTLSTTTVGVRAFSTILTTSTYVPPMVPRVPITRAYLIPASGGSLLPLRLFFFLSFMGEKVATSSKPETLHPVYTVTNIQNKVRVLDGTKVSYSSWVKLFQLHALGYDVLHHIDGTKAPAEDSDEYAAWRKVDAIVLQWIYGSLSDELLVRVLESKSTAFEAWTRIKNLFHNNKGARAAALDHEFSNISYEPFRPSKPTVNVSKNSLISSMMSVAPLMKTDSFFSLFVAFPLSLMLLQLPHWETACNMLQLEQQRQSARDSNSAATPVAATVTRDPPPRRDQRRDHRQSRVPSQRRDQRPSNRPPPSQPTRAQNYPMVRPNVWQTQPPAGYWTPWWASTPPCPFPTQPGWAGPNWPSSARAPSRSQDAAPKPTTPQAHLSEVNPLEPTDLGTTLHAMTLDPGDSQWYMDTGATDHLTSNPGNIQVPCVNSIKSICVGNGDQASVSGSGHTTIPTHPKPIRLNNVLYVPNIIKNLISDLKTGKHLSRHNSTGPLYSFNSPTNAPATTLIATSISDVWHDRLGHPGTHERFSSPVMSHLTRLPSPTRPTNLAHPLLIVFLIPIPRHPFYTHPPYLDHTPTSPSHPPLTVTPPTTPQSPNPHFNQPSPTIITHQRRTPHPNTHNHPPPTTSRTTPTVSANQTIPTPSDNPTPPRKHPMVTRSQTGTLKPSIPFNLNTASSQPISPLPKSHNYALNDPNWHAAMTDEYRALIENNTWELVPRPIDAHIIRCMWLFRHKFHADGSLQRYKARLVVNGKSQQVGIDCDETFSPVVKPTTIRTVLSLATSRSWPIHQLDVKNAFLHGDLRETVYMFQPPGFTDRTNPNYVCRLKKSLYGLKQAPRAWYHRFATYVVTCGFKATTSDTSLFVYKRGNDMAYLLLYVDDIILTASNTKLLQGFITTLSK
ncbi:hypothetical protein OSB04_021856 [Centaurea solstitialis]|uniref:Reverse transcriptase Ty1/copia-type domain-containing protein n=1 Tax=Centaurea solstitialis TaxID=347529 RepID=A0AA38SV94_9ASTR|nr:hypothetical protein OSB04_021856 [Centaurea solstitialis]